MFSTMCASVGQTLIEIVTGKPPWPNFRSCEALREAMKVEVRALAVFSGLVRVWCS